MRIFLIILVTVFSLNVHAAVTVSGVSGASNDVDLTPDEDSSSSTIEIMAGISGASVCDNSSNNTVNTCQRSGTRAACNFNTVCANTKLQVTIRSDNTSGKVVLVNSENEPIDFSTTSDYTSGSSYTAVIPWSELCEEIVGDAGCGRNAIIDLGKSETFKIGVDSNDDDIPDDSQSLKIGVYAILNDSTGLTSLSDDVDMNDGVANYSLFPGDEKAYVDSMEAISNYSIANAAKIVRLRGFFAQTTCGAVSGTPDLVNNDSDSYVLDIDDGTKEITDNRIDEGLTNDLPYVFMFGFEDEAGNIGAFKNLGAECIDDQHSVTPREVHGLLENNQNCFISTAAYGSPLNAKVKTFRKFRDQYLNQFSLGREFVKFYYKNSPPIAETIRENKFLKVATQILLWPAWAISTAALYMGFMPFLFVVTMTLLSFYFFREKRTKKKSSKALLVFFALFFGLTASKKSFAQEDFFSTESTTTKESAPNEPPYNGTENDEFSEIENSAEETIQAEEDYEPEIAAPEVKSNYGDVKESPDKWKPYQRVPSEKRLQELSDEGLMKITKKGGYHYKVKPSEQKSAASFRFGMASFPNLQNQSGTATFQDIYDEDKKPMLMVDYEWQLFQGFGKLGLKVGSGLLMASGKGQFETPFQGSTDAKEKYSFYVFPNSIAAVYRLDIFDKQWLVPFAEVGLDYMSFIEIRDDAEDFKFGGAPHFHFAVGGSFLLDVLGRDMMSEIDSQYGVNHLWLTAEYRRLESIAGDFDFTDDVVNGGIMVEF